LGDVSHNPAVYRPSTGQAKGKVPDQGLPSPREGQLPGGSDANAGGVYRQRRRTPSTSTPYRGMARSAARTSTRAAAAGPGLASGIAVGNRKAPSSSLFYQGRMRPDPRKEA